MASSALAKLAAGTTVALALGTAGLVAGTRLLTGRRETLSIAEGARDGQFLALHGAAIHYLAAGEGEPVVLVHGFGASTFSWRHNLAALAHHRRVYALDLPGFGYSSRSSERQYSLRRTAQTLRAFLSRLGVARASLVGNSIGGAVALQLAHDFPESVDKLVLVGAFTTRLGPLPFVNLPLGRSLALLLLHYAAGSEHRLATLIRGLYGDPNQVTPETVAGYFRPLRVRGSAAAIWAMLASPWDGDLPEQTGAIAAPTLLVWGDRDPIAPLAEGLRLERDLPRARLVVFPGAGHVPHEERPAEFNQLVNDFLSAPAL